MIHNFRRSLGSLMMTRAKVAAAEAVLVVALVAIAGPHKVVAPREMCLEIGKKPRSMLS